MTIKKTYQMQIDYVDGRIEHVERKGKTPTDALNNAEQEFTDAYYVSVSGRKNDSRWRRYYNNYENTPNFPHNEARFGEYVYLHKGRPAKGRKALPKRRYGARAIYLTMTAHFDQPVTKFLKDWINALVPDLPEQVMIP